ncbi:glycosyltransferase [Bacillus mycoides]|uniref:glycosyltransferase n=1 Tax=Bacillus mycoides TaxID=1405 RepID=UPI001C034441|nr:glycosyltransferase [Bacillus mycoides]QWI52122.1 glycosyltransferase [Bacillus mycoides]
MKKKKILFIMTDMSIGGGPKTLIDYLKGLDKQKYDITLYLIVNDGELLNEIPNEIRVESCISNGNGNILRAYKKLRLFFSKKQIKQTFQGYDLVVGYTEYYPTYIVAKINKYLGIRSISWIHTDLSKNPTNFLKRIIHKKIGNKLYLYIDKVICVSKNISEKVKEIYPLPFKGDKLEVIYNPNNYNDIALKAMMDIELKMKNKYKIVFVGRLSSEKNIGLLLEAVSSTQKNYDVKLLIIGEGDEKGNLVELSKSLGIEDRVAFLGYQKNPYPYIKQSDVFVLPSNTEALPGVLIEALSLNVPVIASNVGGVNEIVNHMENGILFEKQNKEELVNAMDYIFRDFKNKEKFLYNCTNDLWKFDSKNSFEQIESIFNKEI